MNIAHIVCRYPPYYGGMGNVVMQTASELAKLGHDITVITPNYYAAEEIRPAAAEPVAEHAPELQTEIDYARRLEPSLAYGNAARLPDIAGELDGFDLVHLHYPFFGTANLVRKWKLAHPDKPLVVTYHMDTRAGGWKGLVFKYYAQFWLPRILGAADLLLGSSFDYIEASDARGVYLSDRGKWRELPFGVDTERFQPRPAPAALAVRLNLNLERPVVLFVGGMDRAHSFKGIPVFLRALALMRGNQASPQAVFVGDGELLPEYMGLAGRLGLAPTVRFAGAVSDGDLPGYYNLSDLLVLPSTSANEAFGMVLLEAMASGVPVVASDLPGVRTVAADGGLLAEPGNPHDIAECLVGYFMPDNDRADWRLRVRQTALAKYAWGPIAQELDSFYSSLVRR